MTAASSVLCNIPRARNVDTNCMYKKVSGTNMEGLLKLSSSCGPSRNMFDSSV